MKTRLMVAVVAVTLLLVTMPGIAAAAKPDPRLTLTPSQQYFDEATPYLEADATWEDVNGPRAYISLVAQVRYGGSTHPVASGILPVDNVGTQAGVLSHPIAIDHPDTELFVEGQLVRRNGSPISAWVDTGWFDCSA